MASSKKPKKKKTKPNTGRAGDGVAYIGIREDGKKYWRARLFWTDPRTQEKHERRTILQANSKPLAMVRRLELIEKAKQQTEGNGPIPTFQEISDAWFETVTARASRNSGGTHKRNADKKLGKIPIDQITARDVVGVLSAMTGSPGYYNSRLQVMINVLQFAVDKHLIETNVARGVKRRSTRLAGLSELGEEPKRSFTHDEMQAYLIDLQQHEPELYPIVVTQLVLGCRFSEVSALRHEDVNIETGLVKIRRGQYMGTPGRTKGKYARSAGLPLTARVLIKEHVARMATEGWPGHDELVFPRPLRGNLKRQSNYWSAQSVYTAIVRSFMRIGLADAKNAASHHIKSKTHAARHTMISLTSEHASEALLRKVVGHKSASQTSAYQHAQQAEVLEFADAVGRKLLRETGSLGKKGLRRQQRL